MDEVLAVFTAEAGGVPDAGEGGRRQGDGERDVSVRLFPVLLLVREPAPGQRFARRCHQAAGCRCNLWRHRAMPPAQQGLCDRLRSGAAGCGLGF